MGDEAGESGSQADQVADSDTLLATKPVDLLHEPTVRRSLWQTRAGNPGIVVTAGEQARIPRVAVLLRDEEGHVRGLGQRDEGFEVARR